VGQESDRGGIRSWKRRWRLDGGAVHDSAAIAAVHPGRPTRPRRLTEIVACMTCWRGRMPLVIALNRAVAVAMRDGRRRLGSSRASSPRHLRTTACACGSRELCSASTNRRRRESYERRSRWCARTRAAVSRAPAGELSGM